MYTVKGSFQNGTATPDVPVHGRDGQPVLITFLDLEESPDQSELENIVAEIAAADPDPANVIHPTSSLAELLAEVCHESSIDSDVWNRQWATIKAEIKRRDLENDPTTDNDFVSIPQLQRENWL